MIMKFLLETFLNRAGRDGAPPAVFPEGIDMLRPSFAQSLEASLFP
jgi:hypothetical protein